MTSPKFIFVCLWLSLAVTSCMSLVKADRLVYAGSIGKKVDAAIIDSISRIDVSNQSSQ